MVVLQLVRFSYLDYEGHEAVEPVRQISQGGVGFGFEISHSLLSDLLAKPSDSEKARFFGNADVTLQKRSSAHSF